MKIFENKPFCIEKLENIEEYKRNKLFEISLVRNLVVHNHGIVNKIHIELLNKNLKNIDVNYPFSIGDSVLNNISSILEDAKNITDQISESLSKIFIENTNYLNQRHKNI